LALIYLTHMILCPMTGQLIHFVSGRTECQRGLWSTSRVGQKYTNPSSVNGVGENVLISDRAANIESLMRGGNGAVSPIPEKSIYVAQNRNRSITLRRDRPERVISEMKVVLAGYLWPVHRVGRMPCLIPLSTWIAGVLPLLMSGISA
jgi:hypothetical protein